MAIKPLKTIKFPGLPDTYTVPQVDPIPTQGSTNAVSSGGVYSAIPTIDATLTQSGQAADAKVVGDEISDIKEDLNYNGFAAPITEWVNGYRVTNANARAALGTPQASAVWRYCKVPCQSGDVFEIHVNTNNYTGYRPWAFADSNNTILQSANISEEMTVTVVAPNNTAYLVCNDYSSDKIWTKVCYKDVPLGAKVSNNTADQKRIANNCIDFSIINSETIKGVSFTVDRPNRTVTVKGTASANALFSLKKKQITGVSKIVLRGCPAGGSSTTYNLAIYDSTTGGTRVAWTGGGSDFITYVANPDHLYSVKIVVFAQTEIPEPGIVFVPEIYADGILFDLVDGLQGQIDDVDLKANMKYSHLAGRAFICECGKHIYIDSVGFRLYDKVNKVFTASKTDTTKLEGGFSSTRYIHFDGTSFTVSSTYSDDTIAYVYKKQVTPLVDGIVSNYRKIQDGYIRANSEYYINYKRTPINALGAYTSPNVKISERGYVYKSAGSVVYDVDDTPITFVLTENTVDISNKKILMIGDSFVARGYIQNWLHSLEETIQFIGTKTTQNYNYKSEGVSGSRLYYFTDPETSPFYFNGELNFASYLSNNNLDTPDYVVINSAINHTAYNNSTYGTYLSNVTALVDMIKAYDNTIKIYVTYGANYAIEPACVYGYPSIRYEEVRKCCNSVYDIDGVTVIPIDSALIDELDYNTTDIDYLGKTVKVLSDCVHPSENVGFRKIANMIYNYLGI